MSVAVSNVSHWRKLLTFPFYFFNFPLLLCVGILQVGAVYASAYAVLHSRETSYLRLVAWLRKKPPHILDCKHSCGRNIFHFLAVCFNVLKRHNYRSLQKYCSVKYNSSLVYVFLLYVYMSSGVAFKVQENL